MELLIQDKSLYNLLSSNTEDETQKDKTKSAMVVETKQEPNSSSSSILDFIWFYLLTARSVHESLLDQPSLIDGGL